MKRLVYHFLSLLLLLGIFSTIIPIDLLHSHEEENYCDKSDETIESNPCHVSRFHSKDNQATSCEHSGHVEELANVCHICKISSPVREKFVAGGNVLQAAGRFNVPYCSAPVGIWKVGAVLELYSTEVVGNLGY